MLAAMFSGRWEGSHKHDRKGRIFLNYNPYCFEKLLSYLRSRAIGRPDHATPAPCIDAEHEADFVALLDHFGLSQHVQRASMEALCFTTTKGVKLSADQRTAVARYGTEDYEYGRCQSNPIKEGTTFVKCRLLSLADVVLGIAQPASTSEGLQFHGCTRWSSNFMFQAGVFFRDDMCNWENGDTVILKIDLVHQRLSMWSTKLTQAVSVNIVHQASLPVVFQCELEQSSCPDGDDGGKVQLLDVLSEDLVHF